MALSTYIKEFFGRVQLVLKTSAADQIDALAEDDGTPKVSNYGKASGTLTAFGVEGTTGEQRMVMMGHDGAALQRVKTETSRELAISLYGTDSSNAAAALEVDFQNILWVRPHELLVDIGAASLSNSEGILVDGSSQLVAANFYEVWFKVNNIDGTNAATYTIGRDISAAGSLSAAEYWAFQESVAAGSSSGWIYGGLISGADDIRGLASAADDLIVQFRFKGITVE